MNEPLSSQLENAIRSAFRGAGRGREIVQTPLEVKRAAFAAEVKAAPDSERVITATISSEKTDRYGDVLRASGFDTTEFSKNPVIQWAHDSKLPPIGRALSVWKESSPVPALAARIEFTSEDVNPFGHQVGKLYRAGYLKSFSVGFRPTAAPVPIIDQETGRATGWEYRSMELLEVSAVNIPAQADARIRACADGILTVREAARIFTPGQDGNAELKRELAELREEVASLRGELRGLVGHGDPLDEFCAYLAPLL